MQPITIVLVNRIVPQTWMNKFWQGQIYRAFGICQLNLLRSCFDSKSCQQKRVWLGVNLSSAFILTFSHSTKRPAAAQCKILWYTKVAVLTDLICLTSTDQSVTVLIHSPASVMHTRNTFLTHSSVDYCTRRWQDVIVCIWCLLF